MRLVHAVQDVIGGATSFGVFSSFYSHTSCLVEILINKKQAGEVYIGGSLSGEDKKRVEVAGAWLSHRPAWGMAFPPLDESGTDGRLGDENLKGWLFKMREEEARLWVPVP